MGKLTQEEILAEIDLDHDFCICCHKNRVSWPMVCDQCQDKEKQRRLFDLYIERGLAGWENGEKWCRMECQFCGMIHDGDITCHYCGSLNPTDEIDDEGDYFLNDDLDIFNIEYFQNGELFEDDV